LIWNRSGIDLVLFKRRIQGLIGTGNIQNYTHVTGNSYTGQYNQKHDILLAFLIHQIRILIIRH
tara:strand:+ start:149 stop:340 length:192 start_codon:yes stop_codon:yes gene_type:complete